MIPDRRPLRLIDFGLSDYPTVWKLQQEIVAQRLENRCPDTLLIGEHPHVITLGRGSHAENILKPAGGEIPIIEIERGGDVTYHGPGQLIAYPILYLEPGERDLHRYLRNLETVLLETLETFGLHGVRNPGWTGVWLPTGEAEPKKIASIGVAVKKWVTYHGIALNVSTDLGYFQTINPCGLESRVMTSLEQVLPDNAPLMETVKARFVEGFERVFDAGLTAPEPVDLADMRLP